MLRRLEQVLEEFACQEKDNTGVDRISGGFARATHTSTTNDDVLIKLMWGIQSDTQNTKNEEQYYLPISALAIQPWNVKKAVEKI